MKKFWQLVSKKDFFFILIIFIAVIVFSIFESLNKVTVSFGEEAVDVKTAKYSMNIPYEMVDSIELMEMPDRGEIKEGKDDLTVRYGIWSNDTWGEYHVCADLAASNCIAVHLTDGRIFVFSRQSNDETANIYTTFQSYLKS